MKDTLRAILRTLPTPKNDYEIVVPEEDMNHEESGHVANDVVEDQADVDARRQQELMEESERRFSFFELRGRGVD